jgi:NADH-quinone oxidoreductase subunit L
MGELKKSMPVTYYTFLMGSLALIGFPFFSGFYSKDLIIEAVKSSHLPAANMAYAVVLGSVFITALYTFRLFFVVFHTKKRYSVKEIIKTPMVMKLPLILLAIPSVISGLFFLTPLQQNYFQNSVVIYKHPETISPWIMGLQGFSGLPFWFGILGIVTAWLVYVRYPNASNRIRHKAGFLYKALKNQLGFDKLYQCTFVAWARWLGDFCWRLGDEWAIDGLGVNGTARLIRTLSFKLKSLQMGYLYHYAFVMILGFLLLVLWVLFSEYI